MDQCVKACLGCYKTCLKTIEHCLEQGDSYAAPDHISLLQSCAELCLLAANFMLRNAEFSRELRQLCIKICQKCADQCERLAGDDYVMKQCAEMCHTCVTTCRSEL
jgi:hypothetical protein